MTIEHRNLFDADLAEELLPSGRLCFEFANTADSHASAFPEEHLHTYGDLVAWAKNAGVLDAAAAVALLQEAQARPNAAEKAYKRAIALREALYRIFSAVAAQRGVAAEDVALLNQHLPDALRGAYVELGGESYRLRWRHEGVKLEQMLGPIVRSAVNMLVAGELDRVRECADEHGCGYLFFDATRNRSRRWCDMNSCGNRAKARRHYARRHTADAMN
jgi:predicted RNA-binding Zn ribbon-like protein